MRYAFWATALAGALLASSAVSAEPAHEGGGSPRGAAPPVHYSHPAAPHAAPAPVTHSVVPRSSAPDQFHPAASPRTAVRNYTPTVTRNVKVGTNPQIYKNITNYHINQYHTTVNVTYAAHPGSDRGIWVNNGGVRWYNGYWHDYWNQESWIDWGGHYGFWLSLDGLNVFVYEYSPGVCWYWNGYEWAPWWNPPYTPYYCPY